ncbi:MAG: recombination-associated protein RdgC [Halomonas sp.]|uniref:Recombination-associated protein RdgC n=1 Tax=Billgrantia tianxiuensis TaxID=2497861 RepID=A0A6I6SRQ2_9GAMM|nr:MULTISPECIES: recombination-associated protein RdgC [Halomonas]MCE8031509.1 recombination-associated protein RdgC [Halomonas sp. MCCC 1A11057]MDX5433316.1 recombination-associated protein RdgC [Halomonas sp.]QHC50317.1 recombination-associated protein RdgC [Halomonas tianxiuensis]
MWFKHLHLYRLHEAAAIPAADLEAALAEQAARTPGSQEARRVGWCPPAGRAGTALLHELQGQRLLTMLRHERLLPAGVVREEVEERSAEIEAREGRKLRRQEKQELKEQVYEELLPRAFIRSQKVDLWWDTRRNLIAVNSSSRKRAEEALDLLRETLGSLKVTPLATQTLPMRAMTQWLADEGSRPASLQLGDQVELKAKGDDGVLRARQVDLDSDEIQQLLAAGRQASRMGVEIEGRLGYVLHDDLTLKSLRFSDALIDEAGQTEDDGDAIVRLEADFILMAQALAEEVERLIDWLGGEANQATTQAT